MKQKLSKIAFILVLFVFAFYVFVPLDVHAAGGGIEGCNEDIYECTDWGECTPEGLKFRTCELVTLCPDADNSAPYEDEPCEYIDTSLGNDSSGSGSGSSASPNYQSKVKCGTESTSMERVKCRLRLTANDVPSGISIGFMPEECRNDKDSDSKELCIKKYSDTQKCFGIEKSGSEIDSCMKQTFGAENIRQRISTCKNSAICLNDVKENVYSLAKSRMYSLENRAEVMLSKGLITKDQASEIIFQLDQQILGFNNAPDKASRIRTLENAQTKWTTFIDGLKAMEAQK
jgi:hypothetical protein